MSRVNIINTMRIYDSGKQKIIGHKYNYLTVTVEKLRSTCFFLYKTSSGTNVKD